MKKEGLLYGALVLLVANFLMKILGFLYRVILVRILGTEGIGLIEMVMPVYTFVLVITTWGIPLAMSRMVAEETAKQNHANVKKIFRLTLTLLTVSGILCTGLVYLALPGIVSRLFADQRIFFCLVTMIPAVFIIAICSVFRAYFQGLKQVSVIGFSQVLEQTIRVTAGIFLALKLKKYGLEVAIVAVALATVMGECAGLFFMIYRYRRRPLVTPTGPAAKSIPVILKELFSFGTPVTLTRLLASLLLTLQATLIPKSLVLAGYDLRTSTELYGRFSGVALSLLHLPGILTMTMAVSILPAIAELANQTGSKLLNHRISESLQISTVFAVPCMIILFQYAPELCGLIFHAPEAGEPLRILAIGGVFLYFQQTLTSILQGMGQVRTLFLNMLFSGSCLVAGILLLTPLPNLGINGAALALATSYFVNSSLNFFCLLKSARLALSLSNIIFKPAAAGLISFYFLGLLERYLRPVTPDTVSLILSTVLPATCLYFLLLLVTGGLNLTVLKRMPLLNRWF